MVAGGEPVAVAVAERRVEGLAGDEFGADFADAGGDEGIAVRVVDVAGEPGAGAQHFLLAFQFQLGLLQGDAVLVLQQRIQARRYQPADNDILFEAGEQVALTAYRRHGQHFGGFLERGFGQETVGGEGGLGDAQQEGLGGGRLAALGEHAAVLVVKPEPVHHVAGDKLGVAGVVHLHAAQHLAQDDLNVLVVDADALGAIDFLDFVNEVVLEALQAANVHQFAQVQGAVHEGSAGVDPLAVGDFERHLGVDFVGAHFLLAPDHGDAVAGDFDFAGVVGADDGRDGGAGQGEAGRYGVGVGGAVQGAGRGGGVDDDGQGIAFVHGLAVFHQAQGAGGQLVVVPFLIVVGNADVANAVAVLLNGHGAVNVGQDAGAFGGAHFEQLLDAGQAGGDVGAGDAAGVESPHRQLGARFADALGGDDADGLADFHQLAGGGQAAVAELADALAHAGLASEGGTHRHPVNAGVLDDFGNVLLNHFVAVNDDFAAARVGDDIAGHAPDDALGETGQSGVVGARLHIVGFGEFAVVFLDDDFLGDVDQAAGEVAAVGGTQGGVGEALAGAVGGDEVLQRGEALAETGLDGAFDDAPLGVAHQAAHSGHLFDLRDVALGAGFGHYGDAAVQIQLVLDDPLHFVGRLGPGFDDAVVLFVLGHHAHHKVVVVFGDFAGGDFQDVLLAARDLDVVDGDGDAGAGGVVEPHFLDAVQGARRFRIGKAAVEFGGELFDGAPVHQFVLIVDGVGQGLVENQPAHGGDDFAVHARHAEHGDGGAQADMPVVVGDAGLVDVVVDAAGALGVGRLLGEVVAAHHHIQGGGDQGLAGGGGQHIVGAEHHGVGFVDGHGGEGNVYRHLVAVEVGIERRADQGVQLDGAALDEFGLESLDAEAVQGGRAVEHYRAVFDDFAQDLPDFGGGAFHHPLGGFDVGRHPL